MCNWRLPSARTTVDAGSQTVISMTYHIDFISDNQPCCSLDFVERSLQVNINNFPGMSRSVCSKTLYVRDIGWKLRVMPREHTTPGSRPARCLGVFLQCCPEEGPSSNWYCDADFELAIVSKKGGISDYVRPIQHRFTKNEDDWGYSAFMSWKDLCNPKMGYIRNSTVSVKVTVRAKAIKSCSD